MDNTWLNIFCGGGGVNTKMVPLISVLLKTIYHSPIRQQLYKMAKIDFRII